MEEVSINVLVDAKTEYTKQLTNILTPLLLEGFNSLYEEAVQFKETTKNPDYDNYSELQIFQDYLRKIPKWNQDIIDTETNRIISKSKCEWLEDLLAAVFISNAKILSVVRLKNPDHKMNLKIPKLRNFIHKCYVECSREIYKNVYLFDNEEITTIDKQKNVRDITNIIKEGIIESVRKSLPVQEIIKTYLGKIYDDEDTETFLETGFEEGMFKDFAKNTLRNSVQEIHSDEEPSKHEEEPEPPKHDDPHNTEESSSSEEEEQSQQLNTPEEHNSTSENEITSITAQVENVVEEIRKRKDEHSEPVDVVHQETVQQNQQEQLVVKEPTEDMTDKEIVNGRYLPRIQEKKLEIIKNGPDLEEVNIVNEPLAENTPRQETATVAEMNRDPQFNQQRDHSETVTYTTEETTKSRHKDQESDYARQLKAYKKQKRAERERQLLLQQQKLLQSNQLTPERPSLFKNAKPYSEQL